MSVMMKAIKDIIYRIYQLVRWPELAGVVMRVHGRLKIYGGRLVQNSRWLFANKVRRLSFCLVVGLTLATGLLSAMGMQESRLLSAGVSLTPSLYEATPPLYETVIVNGETQLTPVEGLLRGRGASDGQAESFEQARYCLAQAMYFEARSEPEEGLRAVGDVVLNRARDSRYPARICDVVFQGEYRRHRCQFSFACDGRPDKPYNRQVWEKTFDMAGNLLIHGSDSEIAGKATHYHADYVTPTWSSALRPITKIGRHIFYQEAGTGPRPQQRPDMEDWSLLRRSVPLS